MKQILFSFRIIKHSPMLAWVGVPGLAVGLAAVLLLISYLSHEFSYDQHFTTKDRVVRISNRLVENNKTSFAAISLQNTLGKVLEKVPGVESGTRIYRGWKVDMHHDHQEFKDMDLLYADEGFFQVFDQQLLFGDPQSALAGKDKVVLSYSAAIKVFGTTDCIGEIVQVYYQNATVSGIIPDMPTNTHFSFDVLASIGTIEPERFPGLEFYTYFLLNEDADFQSAISEIKKQNNLAMVPWCEGTQIEADTETEFLADIHFHTKTNNDLSPSANLAYIYTVAAIALLILLIAIINYMNLYVLHGEKRIREIATRKSFGADKGWLIRLFYSDALVMGLTALILALFIVSFIHPYFAELMGVPMQLSELFSSFGILSILGILFIVVFISSMYPVFYLSRINLLDGLKGKSIDVKRKSRMSTASLVLQFSITIFLVGTLLVMNSQINHLKNIPLGLNPDPVLNINGLTPKLKKHKDGIKEELQKLSFVEHVATSSHRMGGGCSGQFIKRFGSQETIQSINEYRVHPDFCRVMQLELLSGRFFTESEHDKRGIIINEAAAKMFGVTDANQKMLDMGHVVDDKPMPMPLVGIVKDFYYAGNAGDPIEPLALTNYSDAYRNINIRNSGAWNGNQIDKVTQLLKQFDDTYTYAGRELSRVYNQKYQSIERTRSLVWGGALLAILLSLSGLVALSVMNVERRIKEIGMRKVLGSNEFWVMIMLIKDTLQWIPLSAVVAFVGMYYYLNSWLADFANKIPIYAWFYIVSAAVVFVFALLAVSWQTWRAASQNPIKALRYE